MRDESGPKSPWRGPPNGLPGLPPREPGADAVSAGAGTPADAEPSDPGDRRAPHLRLVGGTPDLEGARSAERSRRTERPDIQARRWSRWALDILAEEERLCGPTPLIRIPCPELPGVHLLLKDESKLPSGSLKHRLARALFVHGIASGAIGSDTLIVEGSSGSTAISEAWFAKRLGLKYLAVVPGSTAPAKIEAIRAEGGDVVHAPKGSDLHATAEHIAESRGGYYMDQFSRAAEVADWRGTDNVAAEVEQQLRALGLGAPAWMVAGVGTGGTAATIGRHIRFDPRLHDTRLCVVDPEHSAYFKSFVANDRTVTGTATKIVEGIGRGRVGPAFVAQLIDHMVAVSDEGSVSGAHWLARRTCRRYGPSTGTNVIGALILGHAMLRRHETGTIVLLGCDDGRRYNDTIYDQKWCAANGVSGGGWQALLRRLGSPEFPAAY